MIKEEDILEPYKAYNLTLKDSYRENANQYLDSLVQKSGIDEEANRQVNREIANIESNQGQLIKKIKSKTALKTFLTVISIIFFVIASIAILIGIFATFDTSIKVIIFVISGLLIASGIFFLTYLKSKINSSIRTLKSSLESLENKRQELVEEATTQMSVLNSLFDWNLPAKLLTETIPLIQMDEHFDKNKLQLLKEKYGFKENDEKNISSVFVQSGSILGNPFILEKNYVQEMENHLYEGSITIHWTTYSTDSKGRRCSHHHTQTLTATVSKPRPFYYYDTWLVYGNEAAPHLSFSRQPSGKKYGKMSEKEYKKYIDSFDKKLDDMVEDSLKKGKSFSPMSDSEFEALFNALDRDNDVEFRLLFTPLAIRNMEQLIKNDEPYGDDFTFLKRKYLNYIKSNHSQNVSFDGDPKNFISYDIDKTRNSFISYCETYFQSFFFDIIPLLSIPLYQNHQAFEYIYKGMFESNVSSFETEVLANQYNSDFFRPEEARTPLILKRDLVKKQDSADITNIHAYGFRTVEHVEVVHKMGRDGCSHAIPVTWIEYIPVEKVTPFVIQKANVNKDEFATFRNNGRLKTFLSKYTSNNDIMYQRGLISFLSAIGAAATDYTGKELNDILKTEEK